ncbi:MFS transporter, partial [Streptomyces sp. NPDC005904]
WAVVALLCLFAAATGFAYPIQRKLVNDAVPAHAPRATLLSVESIVDRAVCALAAIAAGAYLAAGRLDDLLWHSALATAVLLGVFQLLLRSGLVKKESAGPAPRPAPPGETRADAADRPDTAQSPVRKPR